MPPAPTINTRDCLVSDVTAGVSGSISDGKAVAMALRRRGESTNDGRVVMGSEVGNVQGAIGKWRLK